MTAININMNLIVYGDQLVASPGAYNGYNVQPGEHWWELLATELGSNPVILKTPDKCVGISPLYYASNIIKTTQNSDDFFISVVPSPSRSLNWDSTGPLHAITENLGPHHTDEYCEWQSNFTYNILNEWAKDKHCLFFVQESTKPSTDKLFVLPSINRDNINQFWGWVMDQHPDLSHPGHFYQKCAPDRKLNAYGHKCVYEVVRKYIIR